MYRPDELRSLVAKKNLFSFPEKDDIHKTRFKTLSAIQFGQKIILYLYSMRNMN